MLSDFKFTTIILFLNNIIRIVSKTDCEKIFRGLYLVGNITCCDSINYYNLPYVYGKLQRAYDVILFTFEMPISLESA